MFMHYNVSLEATSVKIHFRSREQMAPKFSIFKCAITQPYVDGLISLKFNAWVCRGHTMTKIYLLQNPKWGWPPDFQSFCHCNSDTDCLNLLKCGMIVMLTMGFIIKANDWRDITWPQVTTHRNASFTTLHLCRRYKPREIRLSMRLFIRDGPKFSRRQSSAEYGYYADAKVRPKK